MSFTAQKVLRACLLTGILLLSIFYLATFGRRPFKSIREEQLAPGVTYRRWPQNEPRELLIHTITIDLKQPGLSFFVTPDSGHSELDFPAQKTSDFLAEHELTAAVNGGFFFPFHVDSPLDFYPRSNDPVDVIGLSISDGHTVSQDYPDWPVLCIIEAQVSIRRRGCPPGTDQALAGNAIFIENGEITRAAETYPHQIHPRTAVLLNKEGTTMWLLVIDGRQAGYSDGVSMVELSQIALDLGADVALNLDGGGSSTMVTAGRWGPIVRNAPFHRRIPMRERPVANHLGVRVE